MCATIAGIGLAGLGMVLFGAYHWFFVAPVVAVFLEGILWAVGGGALIGWAYQRGFVDRGRSSALWGLAFGTLFASTLVPSAIVGFVWGPFDVSDPGDIPKALPLAFLGVPPAVLIAWLIGERRGIAWSFVITVTVVHFMIGGSIANFGARGTTALMFWGFASLEILGGLWLGWVVANTSHGASRPHPGLQAKQTLEIMDDARSGMHR